mmetsp:Transcript_14000/g.50263  ORF Transcript_14000/g.50263 Transcript_14000/m.50263 type:complete len:248 (-) Transcript_14000:175-918(-)|eukprot:29486-Pelagococcus_subviridis.AAC.1
MYSATARCNGVLSSRSGAVFTPHSCFAALARLDFTSFESVFFARRFGSAPALTSARTISASIRAAAACTAPYPSLLPTIPLETWFASAPRRRKTSTSVRVRGSSLSAAATSAVLPAHRATPFTSAPAFSRSITTSTCPAVVAAVSGMSHVPSPPPLTRAPRATRSLTSSRSPLLAAIVSGSSAVVLCPDAHAVASCGRFTSHRPDATSAFAHSRWPFATHAVSAVSRCERRSGRSSGRLSSAVATAA